MFTGTKSRPDHPNQKARRAFRPEGDRLEAREVLSTFALAGSSTAHYAPGMAFRTATNAFTGLITNISHSATLQNIAISTAASTSNRTATTNATQAINHLLSRSIPREAGLSSNVNTNLSAINRFLGTQFSPFTSSNNPSLTNASAVSNGLAFTNGLGFTDFSSRFTNGFSSSNAAQTGLAFNGSLGSSNPLRTNNGVTTGLAFSNPALATSGLAFTGGLGSSNPSSFSNGATSGLSFTQGLGFTNQNSNPFLATQNSGMSFVF